MNEALSGDGYTGTKKYYCDDGSAPALDSDGKRYCLDNTVAKEEIVTPAVNKQNLVNKALTNVFDLITGANNQDLYESLANAIANAVIKHVGDEATSPFQAR